MMTRLRLTAALFLTALIGVLAIGTVLPISANTPCANGPVGNSDSLMLPAPSPHASWLRESWQAYRDRFIQGDGRVIDRQDNDRSISEGQAYAMLRAVMVNDADTFWRTFDWAERNLLRRDAEGQNLDQLWAWKWGSSDGSWGILDANFATDADIDAATALILAARRWDCPTYLDIARTKLADIWDHGTVELPNGQRQLIPGPKEAFWPQPDLLIFNPSYFAPASFRLFAQVDPERDWLSLVDSGYEMLEASSAVSLAGLPSDWIGYDPANDIYRLLPLSHPLDSVYSFDAYRVWWRLSQDATWFSERRATRYLREHLSPLIERWQQDQRIPARLSLGNDERSEYEATAQYAMLYPALQLVQPEVATDIYLKKLKPNYQGGFWDSDVAYYTQNLAWFGLLPSQLPADMLRSQHLSCRPWQLISSALY